MALARLVANAIPFKARSFFRPTRKEKKMRKKLLLAAAVVLFIALGAAVGVGIMVFRIINGTESLAGSAGAIPQSVAELHPSRRVTRTGPSGAEKTGTERAPSRESGRTGRAG